MDEQLDLLTRYNALYTESIRISNERNELMRLLNMALHRWHPCYISEDGEAMCECCHSRSAGWSFIKHEEACDWWAARRYLNNLAS